MTTQSSPRELRPHRREDEPSASDESTTEQLRTISAMLGATIGRLEAMICTMKRQQELPEFPECPLVECPYHHGRGG